MKKEHAIWLAGFIDGEGYIGIARQRAGMDRFYAIVSVSNTHAPTMVFVSQLMDAPIVAKKPKNNRCKIAYQVNARNVKAEVLIKCVLPYLRTKKDCAINLLAYRKAMRVKGKLYNHGRNQLSMPYVVHPHNVYYLRARELNRKKGDNPVAFKQESQHG